MAEQVITEAPGNVWKVLVKSGDTVKAGDVLFILEVMKTEVPHPAIGGAPAKLIASPLRLSATPVAYRHAPPVLGQHTEQVLAEVLGLDAEEIEALRAAKAI